MRVLIRYARLVVSAILFAGFGACSFAPDLGDGNLACGPAGSCPSGYTCASDGKCYRPGNGPGPTTDAGDAASGPLSTLIVTDVSLLEGSDPMAPAEAAVVVRLVPASDRTVTVDYTTTDETAKAGSDYTATTGTLTFAPGMTTQTVKVKITADRDVEPAETFLFLLSNVKDALLGEPKATCTILDDDTPGVIIDDVTVVEGDTGLKNEAFAVKLTTAFKVPVTLNYSTLDGTALAGTDYIASSGTLTFLPGEIAKTILVPIKGDVADEPDKTFLVTISNVVGAPVLDDRGQGTIQDNDATPTLSITDVSAPEGNAGTSSMTFTVKLSAASGQDVSVLFATAVGTAVTTDYSKTSGMLAFAPGETTKTINVAVNGDSIDEPDETFSVTLSAPVNATIADGVGVGTILNDDAPPTLSIDDVSLAEGMAGNTTFAFTLHLSGPSGKPISVNYATANGTATAPADYTATSGTAAFGVGQTVATVNVTVIGDTVDEGVEAFALNLSTPVNVTVARTSAIGTILNDDSVLPKITIANVMVTEGNAPSTVNAVFTVSLSVASSSPISVNFATADGSATAASGDYVARTGTLNWPAFDGTAKTIAVVVNGDAIFEANETFFVNLSNEVNASITDAQGAGTITNDELQPTVSIASGSVVEGDIGTKQLSLPVTLSGPSSETITVDFATSDGTATAGIDYSSTSGTLTFAPGETSKAVSVSVTGDGVFEPNETLTVTLANPVSTSIAVGAGTATGTIQDDEPQPTLSIDDVTVAEGNLGTTDLTFTVTLSGPSGSNVTVGYATMDGTATAGSDYVAASGSLTFTPLQTSKTITVTVDADLLNEPNETLTVHLSSAVGAGISDADGLGTIQNDDSPLPTLSINDVTLTEGTAAGGVTMFDFTVSLSAPSAQTVTVAYQTVDGTAVAGPDYDAVSNTLTFDPGQTSKTISVQAKQDALSEYDETFSVTLSTPVNASIFDGQGKGTIVDDDPLPSVEIADLKIAEGNNGTTSFIFTVTLSALSGRTVTVDVATTDDTAVSTKPNADYTSNSGTLTFLPGNLTATFTVTVSGDVDVETDEQFYAILSNPVDAVLGANVKAIGTILNDD